MEEEDDEQWEWDYTLNRPVLVSEKKLTVLDPADIYAITRHCDETQIKAVKYIVIRSRPLSDIAFYDLIPRVNTLGFSLRQLQETVLYIRDSAPIIVHLRLDQNHLLQKMIKDTHYRNQFETKISNGSYLCCHAERVRWENRLFDNIYDKCSPFQRTKYGCLNITKDPHGVDSAACQYGDSHFILKAVRFRCSFSDKDSACPDCNLGSCEYYNHILNLYSNYELKQVIEVANGIVSHHRSRGCSTYKEVQIHGEIRFTENVASLIVSARHRGNTQIMKQVEEFCVINKCTYNFTDPA
jgi:hypothetical protein